MSIENLLNGDELLLENIIPPDTEASDLVSETTNQISDANYKFSIWELRYGTIPATHDLLFGEDVSSELIYQDVDSPASYMQSNLGEPSQF